MPTTVKIHNPPLSDIRRKPHPDKIIQQPTPTIPYNPWDFEYPWSRGLCSCKKQCDEACYALWCYPCFACQLAWRLNESCWITCCVPGSLAILRTKIRTAYRIDVFIKQTYNDYQLFTCICFIFSGLIYCRSLRY